MPPFADESRLAALGLELRADEQPCPFIVEPPEELELDVRHYSGGRDATYVVISRRNRNERFGQAGVVANIRYPSFVEGTAIVYDLTAETMQGKARPFLCDLSRHEQRIYALLPLQIEQTDGGIDTS